MICLIVPKPFEEGISNAGLTRRLEVSAIFIEYLLLVIQQHQLVSCLAQRFNTRLFAFQAGFVMLAVSYHRNIGVDHNSMIHS
jgi:hypothetical protein